MPYFLVGLFGFALVAWLFRRARRIGAVGQVRYSHAANVFGLSFQHCSVGPKRKICLLPDGGRDEVNVYLPAGRWVHLWSGETVGALDRGAKTVVAAPLGQPGVLYRQGSRVGAQFRSNLRSLGVIQQ